MKRCVMGVFRRNASEKRVVSNATVKSSNLETPSWSKIAVRQMLERLRLNPGSIPFWFLIPGLVWSLAFLWRRCGELQPGSPPSQIEIKKKYIL